MGITESTEKIQTTQSYFPFGKLYNPSFYLEKNLASFFYSVKEKSIKNLDINKAVDLATIFISRPDQLNKDEIIILLENIIENYNNNEQLSNKSKIRDEQKFIQNTIHKINELNAKYNSISVYRKKEFIKKEYLNAEKLPNFTNNYEFSKIITAMSFICKDSFDQYSLNYLSELSQNFKSIIPLKTIIAPNCNNFLPFDIDKQNFDFNDSFRFSRDLGPHGLTTNGQFLFLLSSLNMIFVFPLINNATLMPPKIIRLNYNIKSTNESNSNEEKEDTFTLSPKSCITAYPDFIEIHPDPHSTNKIKISINSIVQQEDFAPPPQNDSLFREMQMEITKANQVQSDLFLCKISNGVIFVIVQKYRHQEDQLKIGFKCDVYDIKTGELIRNVILQENRQQKNNNCAFYPQWDCDKDLPDLFPNVDYDDVPIETNGTTISFFFDSYQIYRTFSLLTGEFLSDEKYVLDHVISSTIDSINNCRWLLTISEDNKACLRKMKYFSCVDPYIFHIKDIQRPEGTNDFLYIYSTLLKHFCCTLNPPSFFTCQNSEQFQSILSQLKSAIEKDNQLLIQTLCLLISSNMLNNETFICEKSDDIFEILRIPNLDIGFKFLIFFPSFPSFLKIKNLKKQTIEILKYLFTEVSPKNTKNQSEVHSSNDLLVAYALRIIENCDDFGLYPLLDSRNSFNILQNNLFLTLFIIHQRVLIRNIQNFIEDENLIEDQNKQIEPLIKYFGTIVTQFLTQLSTCQNLESSSPSKAKTYNVKLLSNIVTSPVYRLFYNIIRLITPLTNNHTISQYISQLIMNVLDDFIQIPIPNERLRIDILEICYMFGILISTLVSGGSLSQFEQKFTWVLRSNYDLLQNKNEFKQLDLPNSSLDFLNNDTFTLNYLYSKIKPGLNKRLPEDVQRLDKYVITSIAQHMNCIHDFFYFCNTPADQINNKEISAEIRYSFIQMQRVRSQYRNLPKDKKEQEFPQLIAKCIMLFKLKSETLMSENPDIKAKNLADFILSPYSPNYIKGIFLAHETKKSSTQNGFNLLNVAYKKDKNNQLKNIVGHVLKKSLKSFEGLNSILSTDGKSYLSSDEINLFFDNIYPISPDLEEKIPDTRIIPYLFFKSIKQFPDISEKFLLKILKIFNKYSNDTSFYALTVSLIRFNESMEELQPFLSSFMKLPSSIFTLSLIENIIEKANSDFTNLDEFVDLFFSDSLLTSPINIKIIMRIRYKIITIQMNEKLDDYLNKYLLFVGSHLFDLDKYNSFLLTELINLLRKAYFHAFQHENSPIRRSSLYFKFMNTLNDYNNKENDIIVLSLCAIYGYQMETINPYSVITVCSNGGLLNLYLIIQDESASNNKKCDFSLDSCKCYSIPLDISKDPEEYSSLPENALKTVVPEITNSNDAFSDKIKEILMTSLNTPNGHITFSICAQALFNFYKNNSNIITSENQKLIDFMCSMITPFNDVIETNDQIRFYKSLKMEDESKNKFQILPELTPQFGVIQDKISVTYLSHTIRNNSAPFELTLEITDEYDVLSKTKVDLFHFGVISDALEEEQIRISTIGFPTGSYFPEKNEINNFQMTKSGNSQKYKLLFTVNPQTRKFKFESSDVDFPIGRKFKLIIFTRKESKLTFLPYLVNQNEAKAMESIFNPNESPDLDKIISTKRKSSNANEFEDFNFLEFPDFVKNATFSDNSTLEEDYSQYEAITKFSHEMNINQKLKLMSFYHPMNPLLQLKKPKESTGSKGASKSVIDHYLNGLFLKLGRQWITVLLLKIAINNPSLISKYAFDLFALFSIPLEKFDQEEFKQNHFPFSLEKPPWKQTTVDSSLFSSDESIDPSFDFLLTNDMINALQVIIKNPECMDQIAEGLFRMSTSSNLHQIALPQKYHSFIYDSNSINLICQSIVSFNNYEGLQTKAAFIIDEDDNNKKIFYDLPFIYKTETFGQMKELHIHNNDKSQVSILEVNSTNTSFKNEWIIDTPIELLVHLKNFALAAKSEKHLAIVKTILLDLYLGKSPFVIPYIDQFQNFAQFKCSASLFYKDELYMKHLIALAGYLKSMKDPDQYYINLYESEQRLLSSQFTIYDAAHFPEFFPQKASLPEPKSDSILIKNELINPGSIKSGFQSRILMIKLFFQERQSIVGFHFWEILPFWNKIIELYGSDLDENEVIKNDEDEELFAPKVSYMNDSTIKVENPNKADFVARLVFKRALTRLEIGDSTFSFSNNSNFETAIFVTGDLQKPIKIMKGETYFSFITSVTNKPWETLCTLKIEPANKPTRVPSNDNDSHKSVKITEKYKKEFINSMTIFCTKWKQEHTEQLLNLFELKQLEHPAFDSIAKIALDSDLRKTFPKSVLLLRSLFIHQFCFIRYKHHKKVSEFLWNSCANLVPILEKSSQLCRMIVRTKLPQLNMKINRIAAYNMVKNYLNNNNNQSIKELSPVENRNDSIISQFEKYITDENMQKLKAQDPLKVYFYNETGVDASGLTKILLNEASNSIFEPSSQLFMKTNCSEEYFIPETRTRKTKIPEKKLMNEYFSIGVLLGIIARKSLPQNLPFAPFIWKFISGEQITPDDISEVDDDLKNAFKAVRNKEVPPSWTTTSWTSSKPIKLNQSRITSSETGNESNNEDSDDEDDEDQNNINQYLHEVTRFRLSLISPMLQKIREGFMANTELRPNPLLSGKVLSFMVQGTGDITTAMLKEITRVNSFSSEFQKIVDIFWLAVDELSVKQKRELLNFITGVSRIPKIRAEGLAFYINIQELPAPKPPASPDDQLPQAATCFNKLFLPSYSCKEVCKSKILYALKHCLTLEMA